MRIFIVLWLLATPLVSTAQETSSENQTTVVVVPKLRSALFAEASVGQRLSIFKRSLPEMPFTFGVGGGYRLFLEGHGRSAIRIGAEVDYGKNSDDTELFHVGGIASFNYRFFSQLFAFFGTSLGVVAGYDRFKYLSDPDADLATHHGFEVGLETDISFGTIIWSKPFLFAEFTASLSPRYISVGPAEGIYFGGNFVLRIEWAMEDREFLDAPSDTPWE